MTDIKKRLYPLLLIILFQCFTNFVFLIQKEQWKRMADRTLKISKGWEDSAKQWKHAAEVWKANSDRFEASGNTCLDSLDKSVKETNKAIRLLEAR